MVKKITMKGNKEEEEIDIYKNHNYEVYKNLGNYQCRKFDFHSRFQSIGNI